MSKWQAMSAGVLKMPLVLRVSVGSKYGAQHSQDWTSIVAHIPGLKVMFPATPYDAKGMLNLALHGTDPVVFFESQRLYSEPEVLVEGSVPTGYYAVEMGEPAVRRTGSDGYPNGWGDAVSFLEAADILQENAACRSVIDARPQPAQLCADRGVGQEDRQIVLASDALNVVRSARWRRTSTNWPLTGWAGCGVAQLIAARRDGRGFLPAEVDRRRSTNASCLCRATSQLRARRRARSCRVSVWASRSRSKQRTSGCAGSRVAHPFYVAKSVSRETLTFAK